MQFNLVFYLIFSFFFSLGAKNHEILICYKLLHDFPLKNVFSDSGEMDDLEHEIYSQTAVGRIMLPKDVHEIDIIILVL